MVFGSPLIVFRIALGERLRKHNHKKRRQNAPELQPKGISMLWNPEESPSFGGKHPPGCQSNEVPKILMSSRNQQAPD